ncbi:MAG: DUF4013 domain-containing protein [Chloroflexota bacterium]
MNIDIGRSVTYPFEDKQWPQKIGILFVLGFIPGLNAIVGSGYALTIARNIVRQATYPLPSWDDWSDIAVRGLLSIVAGFLYFLPVLLVGCCLAVGAQFLSNGDGNSNGGVLTLVQCCGGVLVLLYTIGALLLLNVGHMRYVLSDQFQSYLELGACLRDLRENLPLFVTLFVFQIILGLIAGAVGALLAITCVGPVAVTTLAILASGYILGVATTGLVAQPKRGL